MHGKTLLPGCSARDAGLGERQPDDEAQRDACQKARASPNDGHAVAEGREQALRLHGGQICECRDGCLERGRRVGAIDDEQRAQRRRDLHVGDDERRGRDPFASVERAPNGPEVEGDDQRDEHDNEGEQHDRSGQVVA